MKVIDDIYTPDICLLCIGDFYTMGPKEAAYAVNQVFFIITLLPKAVEALQDGYSYAL